MKKAYLYNNYVVIEDGINVYLFNIYNSFTVVNSNDYTVQSSVGNRAVILIADASNWYDETGTIPFNAASLLLFLETYTGQFQKAENGIPEGGTTGQILAKIDGTDYNAEWIDNFANWTSQLKHEVKAGEPLIKGQAVYVSSADGTNMIVSKASNASEMTSSKTIGLIAQSLSTNGKGFVITEGLLAGLNTSTAIAGDPVWLGTDGNLIFGYLNKPHAPQHLVFIGIVTRSNNSNGEIFVKVQNGFELNEIHDVKITLPANKNTLLFNSTTSLWENRLIAIDDVSNLQSSLDAKENTSNKGIANGYASLGGDGKVPSTQLPSYVDDVIEVANYAALPSVGQTGVIYITLDNNNVYRWTGSTYVQISQPNAIWGSITGTLSNQTDLQSALNAKQDLATAINTSNIGLQSVAYATNAGNADTLDGYHASAFQMALTNPVTGTGTLNYVAKFGSSSTIENSQIYDNGFQVGIGLTNPSAKFHVNGLSILTNPNGDNYNENIRLPQSNAGFASIAIGGAVASLGTSIQQWTILKDPSNNFMIRHYNTDHLFINTDGNVGLGTSNAWFPASGRKILSLNGASSSLLEFHKGGVLSGYIYSTDSLLEISGGDSATQTFLTSNTERMRIAANGNIGMGTTVPQTKLHVAGSITVPFSHTYSVEDSFSRKHILTSGWNNNGDSKDYLIIQAAGNSNSKVCFPVGNIGAGTYDPRYKISVQEGEISINNLPDGYATPMAVIGAFNNDSQNGGLILKTATGNSLTEKMRILSNGHVGIGTTTPYSKLDITDWTTYISVTSTANSESTTDGQPLAGINFRKHYGIGIGASIKQLQAGGLSNYSQAHLAFYTNDASIGWNDPVERMRITSGGNIGIGTQNPNYTLDVNGFIGATRIYPANSNNTYITGDGNAGMAVVGNGYFYVTASGGSYFQNEVRFRNIISNDINAYLQINGGTTGKTYFAGTIGVGSSAVYYGSSIQVGKGIFYAQDNGSDIGGKIYGFWDSGFQPYAGGLILQVFRNETGSYAMYDAMTLSGSGNVGIGTTTPDSSALLHLESTTKGFLPPQMTDAEMNSISSPVAGLMVWNKDSGSLFVFDGGSWRKIAYV